jgi:hypothetical protein
MTGAIRAYIPEMSINFIATYVGIKFASFLIFLHGASDRYSQRITHTRHQGKTASS